MSVDRNFSRRDTVKLSVAAFIPAVGLRRQEQDSLVARLERPGMAGQMRSRVTDYENDAFVVGVERKLRCTCGCNLDVYTCRTTDFTCQVSPAMHREVVAMVQQDKSAQEILDAFVAKHGEMVLMAPRKEGFNIVGYVLPGMVITAVGGAMLWILSRKIGVRAAAAVRSTVPDHVDSISEEDAVRLQAELADLEL